VVQQEGFTAATAASLQQAREELARNPADVLLIDLSLPDGNGLELLQEMETLPETVLITGQASLATAVEALRLGVSDYLTKPVDFARVKMVLANVARTRELKQEIGSLRGELRKLGRFGPLIGSSAPMQKVYAHRQAGPRGTILIRGRARGRRSWRKRSTS
jgi:DNA-binding NtrC family response regulator